MNQSENPFASPATPTYLQGDLLQPATYFRSAHTVSIITVCLLAGSAGTALIASVADWMMIRVVTSGPGSYGSSRELLNAAHASDARQVNVGILQLLLLLVTAIFFCVWFVRSYRNLLALGAGSLRHSPGWAAGLFFVPFANLVYPVQIMLEIWHFSVRSSTRLIGLWWSSWLLRAFCGSIASVLARRRTPDIDWLRWCSYLSLAADLSEIVAAIALILIIRRVDQAHDDQSRRLGLA